MDKLSKETVILVHGTFAAPVTHLKRWWQPNAVNNFAHQLNALLRDQGSPAECWTHCKNGEAPFSWSGNNLWVDRYWAVRHLRQHIIDLHRDGWTCHLVGHSHGGNVIAEAVHQLRGSPQEHAIRSVVSLGTPFLDTHGAIEKRILRWCRLITIGGMIPAIVQAGFMMEELIRARQWTDAASDYALTAASISFAFFILWRFLFRRRMPHLYRSSTTTIPALAINSRYDEAWQLLHHVRSTPNPLAVRESLSSYLTRRLKAATLLRHEAGKAINMSRELRTDTKPATRFMRLVFMFCYAVIAASVFVVPLSYSPPPQEPLYFTAFIMLYGIVAAFMAAIVAGLLLVALLSLGSTHQLLNFLRPIQLTFTSILSLPIVPSEIVTYIVRKQSWTLVQRWALGLDGYRYPLPGVTTIPERAGAAQFALENLPPKVEQRALLARSTWIQNQVGSASDLFSKLVLTATDVAAMLKQIEHDQSLVHASYYTDEDCIRRIAAWIAHHSTPTATSSQSAS